MAKRYRKTKKVKPAPPGPPKRRLLSAEDKRRRKNLVLFLVFWFIFLTTIYYTAIRLEFEPIMLIYTIFGTVFFLLFVLFNGGVGRGSNSPPEKPPEMGFDEYQLFLDKFQKRRTLAKYCFAAFIPFIMILGVDYTIIAWSGKL